MNVLTERLYDWLEWRWAKRTGYDPEHPWRPAPAEYTPRRRNPKPRTLDDADYTAFERASEMRKPPGGRQLASLSVWSTRMRRRYPLRMRRIASDMAWLRRQARKDGIDPMEVPWLF